MLLAHSPRKKKKKAQVDVQAVSMLLDKKEEKQSLFLLLMWADGARNGTRT